MAVECAYSFSDLYEAAFGQVPAENFLLQFYALPQSERNIQVVSWARRAGWQTRLRKGSDGLDYQAFASKFGN